MQPKGSLFKIAFPLCCFFILFSITTFSSIAAGKPDKSWTLAKNDDGIQIYKREKPGSAINEVLGQTIVNLPPWVLLNVVNDVGNYKDFMPFTLKSRIVKSSKEHVFSYQFLHKN